MLAPLPYASRDNLENALTEVATDLDNLGKATGHFGPDLVVDYLRWLYATERVLRNQVAPTGLQELLYTPRLNWILQAHAGNVHALIDAELEDRRQVVPAAFRELTDRYARWGDHSGKIVVPDTSFLLEHPDKLDEIDWVGELALREATLRVVVPMLVVEELDNTKADRRRARARQTLAILLEKAPSGRGRLQEADATPVHTGGVPRGSVVLEVLPEGRGHRRLPIADDEIIDQAATLETFAAPCKIIFATSDTGQVFRARDRGLEVHHRPPPHGH